MAVISPNPQNVEHEIHVVELKFIPVSLFNDTEIILFQQFCSAFRKLTLTQISSFSLPTVTNLENSGID